MWWICHSKKKRCIEALNTQSSVVNVWEHGIPRRSTDWWIKKKCWKYPQKWAKQQFFTSKESTAAARGFLFSRVWKNFLCMNNELERGRLDSSLGEVWLPRRCHTTERTSEVLSLACSSWLAQVLFWCGSINHSSSASVSRRRRTFRFFEGQLP